jgi:predicted nucleotidyltransferase
LRKKLVREAKARGISANQLCVQRLEGPLLPQRQPDQQLIGFVDKQLGSEVRHYIEQTIIPTFRSELVGVVLFGSCVRKRLRPSSDIDLLIVLRSEVEFDRDAYSRLPEGKIAGHVVSPLIVRLPQSKDKLGSIWMEIALEGVILYDTEFEISQLLTKLRLKISHGEVRRKFSHGVPYWIHQQSENNQD